MSTPIALRYDGEVFRPISKRFAEQADAAYAVDETIIFVQHEERSSLTHRHMFACIKNAWASLPERLAQQFPNPEALRKYALIKAGYADHRSTVCSSRAEAQRIAAFVRPMHEFAIVSVDGATVHVFTPQSQSMRAMDRKTFAESKQKVLDVIADIIGVEPEALGRAA